MANAGPWSERGFGTPTKRIAGPQFSSTPVRSNCAEGDGAADENDVSTFLATLDEFVEHCESFLQNTSSEHDALVVPGRRDPAAGAEVNLQEHACSNQCDCFVEGDVDYGDDSVYTETCCSEPCGSYSQSASCCSRLVSCSEQDFADDLSGDGSCQNLECEQDCGTCNSMYQESGPTSRNVEQSNYQNYSDEMGEKHTHLPLSFCSGTHGKKEGEQCEQHAENFNETFVCCEESEEFDYQNQVNYQNSGEGEDVFCPEQCPKAHHEDEWENCRSPFNSSHQGQTDFMAHKSQENTESASGRHTWQHCDGHLSKSYEVQDSFTVDKERERANRVFCDNSSAPNSHHQELEQRQGQQFAKGSCEMEDAFGCRHYEEEPKEAQGKLRQESFCSGCRRDSNHHAGSHLERIYCKGLGQCPDHDDRIFAPRKDFTSSENQEDTRNASCANSKPTLAQNSYHQELEKRCKPHVAGFQSVHVSDDKCTIKKCEEDSKEGNNKHYLPSFTPHCQRENSYTPESYLERPCKIYPNSYKEGSALRKASIENYKCVRQAPCSSTTGSLKHRESEETRTGLWASSFNSSCTMEDASTFKQHEETVEPEQVTRSELCASSFNSSCTMEDASKFKQHEETVEPEQVTRSELCASSFNSSCTMEDASKFKQHEETVEPEQVTRSELCASSFNSSCTMEDASTFKQHEETVEPEQVTRSELCASSFNSSCTMEDASKFKQHEETVEPEQVTRSELCASSFNSSCTMEDASTFTQPEETVEREVTRSELCVSSFNSCTMKDASAFKQHQGEPRHKRNAGSFSPGSLRYHDHVSKRCLKKPYEKGSNRCPEQEGLVVNCLPSSGRESNFDAHAPSSVHNVCSSDHQLHLSGLHPHIFIGGFYAADEKSALCAAAHDKVSSCDSNNSVGKSMSEGSCYFSASEMKGGKGEGFSANSKDDMPSKICATIPDLTPDAGKIKECSLQPWLQEANVGSPAYFTGIVQAIPDDCVGSPTRHMNGQTVPFSHNIDDESLSVSPSVVSDCADRLHDGEPGYSNDILECDSVVAGKREALTVSEEKFESEIQATEDKGSEEAVERSAANAQECINKLGPTLVSDTCEVSDDICDGTDSNDATLVVADDGNTALSMSKHAQLSPSRSDMSEDVLDISVWIDEDDTFVAEVESPAASTMKTKGHRKPPVQTKELKSESPVPVCTPKKDLHTRDPPDVLAQPHSAGHTMLLPPFSGEAPSRSSSENEDMRKKIDSIRQQRGQQSERRRTRSHEDLHAQASCSRAVGDRVLEHPGPRSEASETRRHAPFMSENPEENMDNENPNWEAVRRLTTEEERYQAVKKVWHNSRVPDPHQELSAFHYRRHLLGLKHSNTPARKQGKRKASHDSSEQAKPAKRQRFDTDIIDLKLKELERKKNKDVTKAQDMFRHGMDMLHRDFERNEAQSSRYRGQPEHRRAHTAPWDFRYYQIQERRIQEEFMASAQSINSAYSARANKLLSARDEVRRFDAFYAGLQDSDPRLLSDRQIRENLKLEELLGRFNVAYGPAKD